MAEQFYTILTNIGKASIANASALGTKVDFKFMALGDGNGNYYNPTELQTELVNEVYRSQINHAQLDEDNPSWITLSTVIPSNVGGFTVREVGIFDAEGNLLAIGKYPETYKPMLEDGSSKDLTINMILEVSNTSVVTLKIDPTVILATKKDIQMINDRFPQIDIIEIKHNSNSYPMVKTILVEHGVGMDIIGNQSAGGGCSVDIVNKITYIDRDNLKVAVPKKYEGFGTPKLRKINNKEYSVTFSKESVRSIYIILK